MHKILCLILICFCYSWSFSQDSVPEKPYYFYTDQIVAYSSIGYNAAPFRIRDNFGTARYRNNMNPVFGIGIAYKWLDLALNFKLPGYFRNPTNYGTTSYFDFDIGFQLDKIYFQYDLHVYEGFNVQLNDTKKLLNDLSTFSSSINAYYFTNDNYKIKSVRGITGRYMDFIFSYYAKGTFNIHGVQNRPSVVPEIFHDSQKSIWKAHRNNAFDAGILPGLAVAGNWQGWQIGSMLGLGGVVQGKFYRFDATSRGFVGLAPRIDFQAHVGYNQDDWFIMLQSAIDNKQIRFSNYHFRQVYHYVRITGGYRFPERVSQQLPVDLPDL